MHNAKLAATLLLLCTLIPSVAADVTGFTCTVPASTAAFITCTGTDITFNFTAFSGSSVDRAATLTTSAVGRYTVIKFNAAVPASGGTISGVTGMFCDRVAANDGSPVCIGNAGGTAGKVVAGFTGGSATGGNLLSLAGTNCQSQTSLTLIATGDTTTHAVEVDLDWTGRTQTWKVDTVVIGTKNFCDTTVAYIGGFRLSTAQSCGGTCSGVGTFSAMQWLGTAAVIPTAPAGISAFVSVGFDGTHAIIQVRWPLSSNDPNQTIGLYNYYVYADGIQLPVDAITPSDGDGNRFEQIDTTQSGVRSFWVVAENATTLLRSQPSCSMSVDDTKTSAFNKCGNVQNQLIPGGVNPAAADAGSGLLGFGISVMGDSDGALFLYGLILVIAVFLAVAGAVAWAIKGSNKDRNVGPAPIIGGVVGGSGMMIFNVFAGIWNIVWAIVLIILTAAVVIFFVRKAFGSGGGGGGESS